MFPKCACSQVSKCDLDSTTHASAGPGFSAEGSRKRQHIYFMEQLVPETTELPVSTENLINQRSVSAMLSAESC